MRTTVPSGSVTSARERAPVTMVSPAARVEPAALGWPAIETLFSATVSFAFSPRAASEADVQSADARTAAATVRRGVDGMTVR